MEGQEDTPGRSEPWYRSTEPEAEPFVLSGFLSKMDDNAIAPPFFTTSAFPWSPKSFEKLWDGEHAYDDDLVPRWLETCEKWQGTICVGSIGKLLVFPRHASKTSRPFTIKLPEGNIVDDIQQSIFEVRCVAWALSLIAPTDPLIVFTAYSLIFIVDANTRRVVGTLRGHGGEITSIAVHPQHPYMFCTTSKDMTTRLYDLTFNARQEPNNPHWPPSTVPSRAGPAFGLMASESEGNGIGRCLAVLVGGRSGGHEAAVLGAAFHPTASLIATCGMDRCVKIWRIPPMNEDKLAREDKPFFSTALVHKARVLSVSWLGQDTLISHSAPAVMRTYLEGNENEFYEEPGAVVIWRWLGFDRFLPAGRPMQKVIRGCASDHRGSQSFKIIASYSLPMRCKHVCVFYDPVNHDPILLIPDDQVIRIFNITYFQPRVRPAFPLDQESVEEQVPELTRRMEESSSQFEDTGQSTFAPPKKIWPTLPVPLKLLEAVPGWKISVKKAADVTKANVPNVEACEVAAGGAMILGVGKRSTLYMWRLRDSLGPSEP